MAPFSLFRLAVKRSFASPVGLCDTSLSAPQPHMSTTVIVSGKTDQRVQLVFPLRLPVVICECTVWSPLVESMSCAIRASRAAGYQVCWFRDLGF
jgi:hypothetical protein